MRIPLSKRENNRYLCHQYLLSSGSSEISLVTLSIVFEVSITSETTGLLCETVEFVPWATLQTSFIESCTLSSEFLFFLPRWGSWKHTLDFCSALSQLPAESRKSLTRSLTSFLFVWLDLSLAPSLYFSTEPGVSLSTHFSTGIPFFDFRLRFFLLWRRMRPPVMHEPLLNLQIKQNIH